jgi:uncharacterized membrane protein HdeD (DUF308 family)
VTSQLNAAEKLGIDERGERRVRWAMVAIGLVLWAIGIALLQWPLFFFAAVVTWASFGLLTEE